MNLIFGSGVVGLLAKWILGPDWKVIPFYRSRYFTYNPPLSDNFIIADGELDPFIKEITKELRPTRFQYRRIWSVQGQLVHLADAGLCRDWLYKIFGPNVPPQAEAYTLSRMDFPVYDIRVNGLYSSLVNSYMDELKEEVSRGIPSEVGDHYIIRNGVREEFENAISTIPLDALCNLMNVSVELPSKTIHYLHIRTDGLDFEGNNQLLVTDQLFDFYKVTNIAPDRYLIYCHNEIPNPGTYFMNFIQKFDILDGTSITGAIPAGPRPKLHNVESSGIFCVGANAQWDWCMDVGSCILRLLRYANRGNKPAQNTSGIIS